MSRSKSQMLLGKMVAILLLVGLWTGQSAAEQGTTAATGQLSPTFAYEGRLGSLSGRYDFKFRLFAAATGGDPVVPSVDSIRNVLVDNGEYVVALNFGGGAFEGDARYLEVRYRRHTTDAGAPYTLRGRAPLLAVPYALSLRPGAVIEGSVPAPGRAVVRADNTGSGVGIWGSATSNAGVYGEADTGVAVWGRNNYGGIAMKAEGSAVQSASQGGWAKALLRIQGDGSRVACYNGVTGSSSSGCGFTVTSNGGGNYTIDFGSGIDTQYRFFSLSGSSSIILTGYPGTNAVSIHVGNATYGYAYYILVF